MGLLPKNENTHSLIVREGWLGAETINESINLLYLYSMFENKILGVAIYLKKKKSLYLN